MYFKTIETLHCNWSSISNENENSNDMHVIPNSMDVAVNVNWAFEDVSPHIFITWNSVNATLKLRACIQTWKIYSCIFDLVHYFLTSITKEFGRNFIIVTLSNVQIAPAKTQFWNQTYPSNIFDIILTTNVFLCYEILINTSYPGSNLIINMVWYMENIYHQTWD